MDTPDDEAVEVRVGDKLHRGWTRYDIESDLMMPADAWSVSLGQDEIAMPPEVDAGAVVEVRVGGETVLQGRVDTREHVVRKGSHELVLRGRDGAGVLLDCSAPITTIRQQTLSQVVAKVVRPLGVTRVRIEADVQLLREKVNTEPGDTAWDSLRRAAEANGLWPWFEPDGTLVVGGPRYDQAPVAHLVMTADGRGNNVEAMTEVRDMAHRFSEVTVLGQAHSFGTGAGERDGRHNIKTVVVDDGVPSYRPRVIVDHEAINETIARARGRKFISDARLRGFTLAAEVMGHRTAGRALWKPGQRVSVRSEPHKTDGVFFLMARRLVGGRNVPKLSLLTLKEDGVWTLDAHPSTRRHRRGKNSLPGKVMDLPAAVQ